MTRRKKRNRRPRPAAHKRRKWKKWKKRALAGKKRKRDKGDAEGTDAKSSDSATAPATAVASEEAVPGSSAARVMTRSMTRQSALPTPTETLDEDARAKKGHIGGAGAGSTRKELKGGNFLVPDSCKSKTPP